MGPLVLIGVKRPCFGSVGPSTIEVIWVPGTYIGILRIYWRFQKKSSTDETKFSVFLQSEDLGIQRFAAKVRPHGLYHAHWSSKNLQKWRFFAILIQCSKCKDPTESTRNSAVFEWEI